MQKKGQLEDQDIKSIVDKWNDDREEDDFDSGVVEKEVKNARKEVYTIKCPMGRIYVRGED